MEDRRFVLEPLAEIAPDLVLHSGRTVREALACVREQVVTRLLGEDVSRGGDSLDDPAKE
jgi:7,8-dihydro-6-hydroxymethylpterin-pyrophosphokinase